MAGYTYYILYTSALFFLLHSYYADGRTVKEALFYNVTVLDTFIDDAIIFKSVCDQYAGGVDVWIGETASTYGGGTPGLSDSYVSGFM